MPRELVPNLPYKVDKEKGNLECFYQMALISLIK